MDIQPIKTEKDYELTLAEINKLFDAEIGTPQGDKLDIMATLVQAYEKIHHPIQAPNPVAAIEFVMEQQGLTRKDLEPYLGGRSRVAEILNHKRKLTLSMIRKLSSALKIPTELLVAEY